MSEWCASTINSNLFLLCITRAVTTITTTLLLLPTSITIRCTMLFAAVPFSILKCKPRRMQRFCWRQRGDLTWEACPAPPPKDSWLTTPEKLHHRGDLASNQPWGMLSQIEPILTGSASRQIACSKEMELLRGLRTSEPSSMWQVRMWATWTKTSKQAINMEDIVLHISKTLKTDFNSSLIFFKGKVYWAWNQW